MNKKLIAVAVGSALGALAAPAFAQSSTVTLSGNLNYAYGYFDNGGAGYNTATISNPITTSSIGTPKLRHDAMINQESEWVLTGEENLGGGMAAYFRCAQSMDIVAGGASVMCARTSYIGLKAGWGKIDWGNNDTPIKNVIALYDPFPISAPYGQGQQMFNSTSSALGNTNASFSRRQNNLITYSMPTMNGFDAAFAFTPAGEASTLLSSSTIQKARMWSAMLNYTNGPLMLGAGYERHIDFNPAGNAAYNGGRDSSYQLGISYTFMGSLKVSAIYVNMHYDNLTSATVGGQTGGFDMSAATYGVYANWAISGPHSVKAGYGNQGSTKGTYTGVVGVLQANAGAGQTGAQKFNFEYQYDLSKRTNIGLNYARTMNDRVSNIGVGTGGATPNFGETQTWAGIRIGHKF